MLINGETLEGFYTTIQKIFSDALGQAKSQWQEIATLSPSTSKSNTYPWVGKSRGLKKWIGDKQVDKLAGHKYTLVNEAYEDTVEVDRDDFEDDNLGVYTPLFRDLAYGAAVWPDENIFRLLLDGWTNKCYDNKPFFSNSHKVGKKTFSNDGGGNNTPWFLLHTKRPLKPLIFQQRKAPVLVRQDDPQADNVFMRKKYLYGVEARGSFGYGFWQMAYGSKQELTPENYAQARAQMGSFTNEGGKPLGMVPDLLVVPPSLEERARKVLVAAQNANGESNVWAGTARLLVSAWLVG